MKFFCYDEFLYSIHAVHLYIQIRARKTLPESHLQKNLHTCTSKYAKYFNRAIEMVEQLK